jgi:hypothetical protein
MLDTLIFLGAAISLSAIFWIAYSGLKIRDQRPVVKRGVGHVEVGAIRKSQY